VEKREISRQRTATRRLDVTVESQRRKQIIDAAKACINEEGLDKLTLRKVAERARVSHATIAYYFNTRKELVDSALVAISNEFMIGLRQRNLLYGTHDLVDLIDRFLDSANPSARFVVQMIDSGMHDVELRDTHSEFMGYGRERIERSIRAGVEMGELRCDVDPEVAAVLLHSILIFWQSLLVAGTATREMGLKVSNLVLTLLNSDQAEQPPHILPESTQGVRRSIISALGSPVEVIEASLMNDPNITPEAALTLSQTFRQLYGLVVEANIEHPQRVRKRANTRQVPS
jgi:AcrR family transcriptional regulator